MIKTDGASLPVVSYDVPMEAVAEIGAFTLKI